MTLMQQRADDVQLKNHPFSWIQVWVDETPPNDYLLDVLPTINRIFQQRILYRIREYLYEKNAMGLFNEAFIIGAGHDYVDFYMYRTTTKIWKEILRPALEQYTKIKVLSGVTKEGKRSLRFRVMLE